MEDKDREKHQSQGFNVQHLSDGIPVSSISFSEPSLYFQITIVLSLILIFVHFVLLSVNHNLSSYQHADRHVGTFPHLLSLRVFKDKGHMTTCIFLVPTSDEQ